ncbi:restriction endonuclease subunit S [Shewanella algae]|uniref:restriction endonuclease subunit S n=1 Tax=Shewanella algae TaxID=38313 RepID=UPI003004EACA
MGKHKAYPEYKGSGVEWIGQVPNHWDIHSLKRTVKGCVNGIWGAEPDGESDLIVLRVADFDRVKLDIRDDKLTYRSIPAKDRKSRLLKSGDLLIEKSGGGEKTLVGCVVRFDKDYPAVTSNFVAKMSPLTGYDSAFLNYAFAHLYSGRVNYPAIKQTTGIQNLDSDAYLMERFAFPSSEEQRTIAAFLDYETARIDSLIDKQQRLIELLKEKRQAVISHAVTKGLNPDVRMKDSGVEWLGQVPEHWEVTRLKYVGYAKNGLTYSPDDVASEDDGVLVLRSSNIQNAKLSFTDNVYVNMDIPERIRTQKNDLLICSRNGSRNLIGKNALITEEAIGMAFGAFMVLYRSNLNSYLYWVLNSPLFEYQSGSFLTSTINQLTIGNLGSMEVPLPPHEEQWLIEKYLKEKNSYFERLIQISNRKVELLQERRTALISAAVTGKIDLRGWTPPVKEDAA